MLAHKNAPVPGSRPKGTRDDREAAAHVRKMFSQIAPRYDFLNHLLSFSLDHVWRRRTAKKFRRLLRRTEARVLDLCCGTGDLTFALNRVREEGIRDRGAHRVRIIGCDFAQPMLQCARKKSHGQEHAAIFISGDALQLPFRNESFDLVSSAFGFRNLSNYEQGLREIARVLKPGGQVAILEFSEPKGPAAGLFRFYFRRILPLVGAAISGSSEAYFYLPGSVAKFPSPLEITALMQKTGFNEVEVDSWNFKSVVLHTAKRV
ncbi:MAG: bifunctional demethylmenaquinone methyltransferase/2-methoxy-6-polyprenyl-1,4-benzoquinol methylase UbiE [Candidatus Acidiferrales bacterium]